MAGILYGVGVGPGDPELLTLKAVKIIESCDIIGIPAKSAETCTAYQVAGAAVPDMTKKPVLALPIPMTTDSRVLEESYKEGCRKLKEQLEEGKRIAFLNLGDPTIYGTYMAFHERLQKAGYTVRLVSGVPSFCAVAAALDLALGSGKESIHILPGFYCPKDAAVYEGTRILMKSAGRVEEVKRELQSLESAGKGKAYAVTNCGMEEQVICRDIGQLDEKAGYFTTIIIKDEKEKQDED